MRVCFISFEYPPNILGGAGTYAEALVKGLKRRGIDVFVISKGNEHDERQRIFRVPTSDSPYWRRLFFMKSALSLFQKLSTHHQFDLVHFNEPHIILQRLNLPAVCTVHSTQINEIKLKLASAETLKTLVDIKDFLFKGTMGSIFDILTTRFVDKIICPSSDLDALVRTYCFVDENRTCVIQNGIDLESFGAEKSEDLNALKEYGLKRDKYILFVGRLTVLKGVQYLIKAFQSISQQLPDLTLVIVGKGDFEASLKNLAGNTEKIVFTGHIDSLKVRKTLYENSLFVVVPSLYEALPMVVLEAMACGKAVIASNVGGIPMLVRHEKNGFLAKPGDSEVLARLIRSLCTDRKLRSDMGLFGRKLIEQEFTVEHMVDRTLKVYDSLALACA